MRKKWELSPFGVKAKKRLVEKGMTQTELAKKLGFSVWYIGVIFRGNGGSDEAIEKIAKELGIKTL